MRCACLYSEYQDCARSMLTFLYADLNDVHAPDFNRFNIFPKMAFKAKRMAELILGQHSGQGADEADEQTGAASTSTTFAIERPDFDDTADTIYLLVGGVYRDGVACRTCMYSQKVETLYSSCGIDYTPILIDFNDKPAWFVEEASNDGTTPTARHRGQWIAGSATLLQYCYDQYPLAMAKIASVAPAFSDTDVTAVTKGLEAWIVIDPTCDAEWRDARARYLATLTPMKVQLEATKYLCGNESPGREDYVWYVLS